MQTGSFVPLSPTVEIFDAYACNATLTHLPPPSKSRISNSGGFVKGEIQCSGKFHSYDRYDPCEVCENIIFTFVAPWCSEFNFRIQLLASLKYNPVPQQWTTCTLPTTTHSHFEYTQPRVYSKRSQGFHWE
jgi:hypothetical protein